MKVYNVAGNPVHVYKSKYFDGEWHGYVFVKDTDGKERIRQFFTGESAIHVKALAGDWLALSTGSQMAITGLAEVA